MPDQIIPVQKGFHQTGCPKTLFPIVGRSGWDPDSRCVHLLQYSSLGKGPQFPPGQPYTRAGSTGPAMPIWDAMPAVSAGAALLRGTVEGGDERGK